MGILACFPGADAGAEGRLVSDEEIEEKER